MLKLHPAAAAALAFGLAALAAAPALPQGADENPEVLRPLDLTRLAPEAPADDEAQADPAPAAQEAQAPGRVSAGFNVRKPSTVRLASLGLDRPAVDGLDRLMWGTTGVEKAMALLAQLPETPPSPAISLRLEHVMLARAVPPGGTADHAETLVGMRLEWLRRSAGPEDLASLVRQLPDQEPWLEWKQWLVLHDLINRNDEAGCGYARERAASTLDSIWHQINAFCMVVGGEVDQASFGLDILADSGLEDPAYFALMERLTGAGGDAALPEDSEIGPFNLVLMDSAKVEISSSALQSVENHRTSLGGLRYLGEDAQILLGARLFDRPDLPVGEVLAEWASLPVAGIPVSEALTGLSIAEAGDEAAIARFLAWQAIALEESGDAASELALRALSLDFDRAGGRSLELWAPFLKGDETMVLKALLPDQDASSFTDEAEAWRGIVGSRSGQVRAAHLVSAGAIDAIPLLLAAGRQVAEPGWQDLVAEQPALAPGGASLRFGHLLTLEAAAKAGNKAETLLAAAGALGPAKPWRLGRDDAARLVAALAQAGLEETAQGLAREILVGWALGRYFAVADQADGATG